MQTLILDYFKRDLSEFEEAQLQKLLEDSTDASEALLDQARLRYQSYGLPNPATSPVRPLRWLAVAACLTIAVGTGLLIQRLTLPSMPPSFSWRNLPQGAGTSAVMGFARKPALKPVEFQLTMPRPGLAVIRVLDGKGAVVRIVEAEYFMAGTRKLVWDGLDSRGRLVGKGWTAQLLVNEQSVAISGRPEAP